MNTRITIMPDVMLTAVQTDKFKTGCFSINLLRPLCRKEASKNALILSVLLRGTEQYPDIRSLSAAMDELYGTEIGLLVRKKGETQAVGLYADFVEDALLDEPIFSKVVDLVAQILLRPKMENGVFCEQYVEREKEALIHSIQSRINSKRSYAVSQMVKTMCLGEAFSTDRLGEEEDVAPITAQSLYDHYEEILSSSRVEICYMGRKTPEEVAEALRAALQALPRKKAEAVSTVFKSTVEKVKTVEETLNVTQGKLCMGFRLGCRGGDNGWPAMQVMTAIFGSGITSKLFVNVREKMSLCYYASAALENFKGIMTVSSGIEFSQFETAKTAILQQLEDCRNGVISDYELESAKKHLLSSLKTSQDSPGLMDEFHLGQAIAGRTDTKDEIMMKIEAVTKEEAAAAARQATLDTVYFLKGAEA